ncbi:MAG TPA: hypothetical protein VOA78_02130 [Candidatus Dormibacteraeota bacterium]|nr:hypothetical protein [Candidatus Dormibacteraeota bacterium]
MKLAQIAILAGLVSGALCARVAAQNPDTMMPEANQAKARQILKDAVEEMGGPAYLSVRQRECAGRRAQFGHAGELSGYIEFKDYWEYPDKTRTEYVAKGHNSILGFVLGIDGLDISGGGTIITQYNGNEGWVMDKAGVEDMPATSIADFQELAKRNTDNLLRLRLKEEGVTVRYAGPDIVDLKPVEWVEIRDQEQRVFRLAVEKSTHLLVRSVATITDDASGQAERTDESTIYSNYQRVGGLYVPLQISRERNGRKTYQAFLNSCNYNPGLPEDFFTKAALEKRFAEVGKKKDKDKYKTAKD